MRYIARLQETLAALDHDPGPADDVFGPRTGTAFAFALRAGDVLADAPIVLAARDQVRAGTPHQRDILARYDQLLLDDPKRPGYGIWRDPGAKTVGTANLRAFSVPLLGTLVLDRHAAGAIIAAWGEVAALVPTYKPGRACSMCVRRMNRDVHHPWSMHSTGYAVDVDLDGDGRWERIEAPVQAQVMQILESWGLVLGLDWTGKNRDDMHHQWATVK